ncbi:MAG TPA: hypothetical protein VI248_20345 [Kineosporiaceae bacterium]
MAETTLADLDRCPHGRHRGDPCVGHRGPGLFHGGCQGGLSLGNPWPDGGDRIGTTIHGVPILQADLPVEGRPSWVRARFHAELDDYRPVRWPPPGPYWCTGYGEDYSVVVAYLRPGDEVTAWWPEASEVEVKEFDAITFTSRFARPDWWSGMEG